MNVFLRFVISLIVAFVAVAIMVAIRNFTGFHSQALTGAVGAIAFMVTWATAKLMSSR